ncbi:MAG TPA: sigma factor-like helix-turn-helix DNA-binding protein, partial [Jatrophihabitans sp.]|nr:sigma factor-like helix-turn-helix DNA-binding protein [Jatrophihabitans sp.]
AFVMHDVFGTPFDAIAESLGRTPATCRQLARRARRKLDEASGEQVDVSSMEHREVTERFIAACAGGDLEALIAVLDPDVWGDSDYGGGVARGASHVARGVLRFWSGLPSNYWRHPVTVVSQPVGKQMALLGYIERELVGVLLLDIVDERVVKMFAMGDESKLAFLSAQLR